MALRALVAYSIDSLNFFAGSHLVRKSEGLSSSRTCSMVTSPFSTRCLNTLKRRRQCFVRFAAPVPPETWRFEALSVAHRVSSQVEAERLCYFARIRDHLP